MAVTGDTARLQLGQSRAWSGAMRRLSRKKSRCEGMCPTGWSG